LKTERLDGGEKGVLSGNGEACPETDRGGRAWEALGKASHFRLLRSSFPDPVREERVEEEVVVAIPVENISRVE
jgi:hypothetical protein